MPEYSSTTITPADAVKVPAMNGSTSGNFQLDALRNFILASKGAANGLASLGSDGKLPLAQLPDLADDVLVYSSYATFPATGTAGKIYIAADTNIIYRWDDSLDTPAYVILTIDLSAYETKAEASELKSAITDTEQRVQNLEQAVSGSLVQTNVLTDPPSMANVRTITNANTILPWALLNRVGARSVAWNQLVDSGTSSLTLTNGHKYVTVINGTATKVDGTGQSVSVTGGSDNVHDLTMMGLDSLTANQFKALFPASYYPYNAGTIYDLPPTSFEVVGFNKWDENVRLGSYNNSSGQYVASYTDRLCSTNMTKVMPNTTYYFKTTSGIVSGNALYYDSNGNFISSDTSIGNNTFTTPPNCYYINIALGGSYGTTYNNDVCINISQTDASKPLHNGVYQAYQKTTLDTSFTSDYKYVNSSCYDYSENVYVDGVMKRKDNTVVDSISLASLIWTESGGVYSATVSGMKSNGAILCDKYEVSVSGTTISITTSSSPTGTLYYEKATPTETINDTPIPNFPVEDGTTITAITPQTELVNAIDVPNTIAYMTKIGG